MAEFDSRLYKGRPSDEEEIADVEKKTYDFLDNLGLDYETLKHPAAFTMEECEAVRKRINAPVFKNLFLTNKQHSVFYLLLMPADKPFKTKYLSSQLGCARLSFATEEKMISMLGVHPGAVTPMGLINDSENKVNVIIDKDLASCERYACHPCINTGSVSLTLDNLLHKVLPATGHNFSWVSLPSE